MRIDSVAQGRRFDQVYRFAPYEGVGSYESASVQVRHELPDAPAIRSWRIEAAEFQTRVAAEVRQ